MPAKKLAESEEKKQKSNESATNEEEHLNKKASWINLDYKEIEKIIIDLAKQGNTASQIGIILRDKYGIPKIKMLGKKLAKILKEAKVTHKNEKDNTNQKIEKLKTHFSKHKHDYTASRSLTKKLWALHAIEKAAK